MMKDNFKEKLAYYKRHAEQYGPPGAHHECPLIGRQCPVKDDEEMNYSGNYGWTDKALYETMAMEKTSKNKDAGENARVQEFVDAKKDIERNDAFKTHYEGRLLDVSRANGSCASIDGIMDKMEFAMEKWIEDITHLDYSKSKVTHHMKMIEVAAFGDVLIDCKLAIHDLCGRAGMKVSWRKTNSVNRSD
jgi:hypothetical protein